jgi:predicted transcriptional regulator
MRGDTIARVRREHFGKTIKEMARDLHLSRNTVRKILRSGASSFEYERRIQLKRSIAGIAKGSGQPRQAWVSWDKKCLHKTSGWIDDRR